jgi:Lipocalin-like domain
MSLRNILNVSAIAALGLTLLPSSVIGRMEKPLREQLVGTWTLISWEQDVTSGPRFQRFGASPRGFHIFDENGRFYITFLRPDLPKLASANPLTPTPEEAKAIVSGSIALFGTYTVDEGAKVVTLNIESSSFPNQLGAPQKRTITLITPTELRYQNTTATAGGQIYYVFKR